MSGNIFASSTVPGIKDRDRDKQVVALWGQSYYLSRHDFTTTYWVKLMIGSTLLMLVVPVFLSRLFFSAIRQPQPDPTTFLARLYPPALRPSQSITSDTFGLAEIPISAVLTQALATANGTRSRGILTHALLELQNPELTSFAGPGYGVYLRQANRGATLEAFPDGKLPWCGVGGRYDEWGRVKGLRYAYQSIITTGETSLTKASDKDNAGEELDVESLLMGWPALLLERARVDDPLNPLPPGSRRNVYGEAIDRVVKKLCADGGYKWDFSTGRDDEIDSMNKDEKVLGDESQQRMIVTRNGDRQSQHSEALLTYRAVSAFLLPPFLATYAVARQDPKWLVGAVNQLEKHLHGVSINSHDEEGVHRRANTADSDMIETGLEPQIAPNSQSANGPWLWAGAVRVLSVLKRWKPNFDTSDESASAIYEDWKKRTTIELKEAINTALSALREENRYTTEVLSFCVATSSTGTCEYLIPSPAMTGLLVESLYRLAQLEMLNDLSLLVWADDLYNAVARHVSPGGNLGLVVGQQEEDHEDRDSGTSTSEGQSMVIMMWAARRDCAKAGICRVYEQPSRWRRLMAYMLSFILQ